MITYSKEFGPAGQPVKPYRNRCLFGRSHLWIEAPGRSDEVAQCANCGCGSSNYPDKPFDA